MSETVFGTPFVRALGLALARAGWQSYPASNLWRHDASGCEVSLATSYHVWLWHQGKRLRLVGSRKHDAQRAAEDVAEQCWEQAALLSAQAPADAP